MAMNGLGSQVKSNVLSCFAKTVNNLPVLFTVSSTENAQVLKVTYKTPVAPLKALVEDCIRFMITHK
jgi:hypothetical protein